MLKNYLRTTLRSLLMNKTYSLLNIAGLAIGIASAAMIFLWVEDELGFDHQYEKRNYLYKVYQNQIHEGHAATFRGTPGPMAPALKADVPGIKNTARISPFNTNFKQLFTLGSKTINEQGYYADSTIFSMLSLTLLHTEPGNPLRQLYSLVISESMSRKFFGDHDPLGKSIKVNNEQDYVVTGVFKDLPANSTLQFQWLSPYEIFRSKNSWLEGWGNNGLTTLVELDPGTSSATVNKKLAGYLGSKAKNLDVQCFLFSMNDWHLYSNFTDGKQSGGQIKYVKLFSLIAWIILFIACINFMNLATARSEKRAREVGVRKVMGAGKTKLIAQFMGESLIMSFVATLSAIVLLYLSLPGFNSLVGKQLSLNIFNPLHMTSLIIIAVITGIIAGSYPAFYLSSFNPVMILKGIRVKTSASAGFIRKGLVVLQFSVSVFLIISTVVIYQQVQHARQRDLGLDKDNLIYLDLHGQLKDHFDAIRNDLLSTGVVENAALSDAPLLQIWGNTDGFSWEGKDPNKNYLISFENISPHYLSTAGMKTITGRDFYSIPKVDSSNILITESLAKLMGNGKGPRIISASWGQKYNVIGVIKDFVFDDMYAQNGPVVIFCNPTNTNFLTIRFKKDVDLQKAVAKTEAVIKTDNPIYPFDYRFVDEDFNQSFKTETLIGKLAGIFASLAIFISCLGLFGLAAYTAESRTKEIGIRKVLGASASGLAGLLSKDFLQLVAISCMIAFPVALWAMNNWLRDYQYRTPIYWWVFAVAAIIALTIALGTVSFQAIKAAIANPVKSLRSE
jgi:putative ABC transport system permease protein